MAKIYLYGVFGLPGIVLGIAYLGYSYYMDKKGGDIVNHDAHSLRQTPVSRHTLAKAPILVPLGVTH